MVAKAQIAAILAVMQEYLALPPGSFRIDRIEPGVAPMQASPASALLKGGLGNAWKLAGRLELMGFEGGEIR